MSSPASDDESMPDDSDFRQQLLQKLADFGKKKLDDLLHSGLTMNHDNQAYHICNSQYV